MVILIDMTRIWQVSQEQQLSLVGVVNLRQLPNLHIFAIHAIINCDALEPVILRDIVFVLSTIPKANQLTKLSLNFTVYGEHPFTGCLNEDWVGMCVEVVRISAGKLLELDLDMSIIPHRYDDRHLGRDELYGRIKEKTASLSDYPNICSHWHPHSDIWSNI